MSAKVELSEFIVDLADSEPSVRYEPELVVAVGQTEIVRSESNWSLEYDA